MKVKEALLSVKRVVENFGDRKAIYSFYHEFHRRLEALKLVKAYCKHSSALLGVGAQPL